MKKHNILYSSILLAIGVFAYIYAGRYSTTSAQYVTTAALFPRILSGGLIITALVILVQTLLKKKDEAVAGQKTGMAKLLLSLGTFAAYYLLLKPFGFIVASALLVFVCMYRLGCRKWWVMGLYSILLPAAIFAIFYYIFYVSLPLGILSGILPKY